MTTGRSWWASAWITTFEERSRLDPNRMPRGRECAASGQVTDLALMPDEARARLPSVRRPAWCRNAAASMVAPSFNVDIGPVIWHCRRARRNLLFRNLALFGTVLLGCWLNFPASSAFLSFLFFTVLLVKVLPMARWAVKKILYLLGALAPVPVLGFIFDGKNTSNWSNDVRGWVVSAHLPKSTSQGKFWHSWPQILTGNDNYVIVFLLLLVLAWGIEFTYTSFMFRTLTKKLKPQAAPSAGMRCSGDRIALVEAAQHGNITLYAADNPFIGAGLNVASERVWSIAVRLDPANPARTRPYGHGPQGEDYKPIDPVELHEAIHRKLHSLNDERLPENEQVNRVDVSYRLVGSGLLPWGSPLIDKELLTPYSHASIEAVRAVISHPQAHLRCYQHVVVSDEGPSVKVGERLVLNAADLGVSVSAFIYAAVEGRHFYLQFIMTTLPPIKSEYRKIDLLPKISSGKMIRMLLWRSTTGFLHATLGFTDGVFWAVRLWSSERRSKRETQHAGEFPFADLGARVSVRELGTANRIDSHIGRLDVEKYHKIIERAVLETVQDFLAAKEVDISAFSDSALNVINSTVIGSVSGGTNQFGGSGNTVNQQEADRRRRRHPPEA